MSEMSFHTPAREPIRFCFRQMKYPDMPQLHIWRLRGD
jgi:hypothetical protein